MTLKKLIALAALVVGLFASGAPASADAICARVGGVGTVTVSTVDSAVRDAIGSPICVPLP